METSEDADCLAKSEKACKVLGTVRTDIREIKSVLNSLLNEYSIIINSKKPKVNDAEDWSRDKNFG